MNIGFLEAIEGGGCGYSVGTHVLKEQPVAHLHVRQAALLHNAVQPITGRAPNAAGVHALVRLGFLGEIIGCRLVSGKKHHLTNRNLMKSSPYLVQSWQDMRMVIQNTVEGTINPIVHVVHQGSVIGPILFFCKNDIKSVKSNHFYVMLYTTDCVKAASQCITLFFIAVKLIILLNIVIVWE